MLDPLHQFTIKTIVPLKVMGYDISFTNSSLFMCIAVLLCATLLFIATRKQSIVPGRLQSFMEITYEFIAGIVKDNAGPDARPFFPFVFTLFMFILFGNALGMVPFTFTFTSHIIVTFALAAAVFFMVTIIGLIKHKWKFFSLFLPHGTPLWLGPVLIPIELISYLSRPVSLSARLFANVMAGHMILKIFASFIVMMGIIGGWIPLGMTVILTAFEFFVAFMQAYIFSVLTCIYLKDALHLH